MGVSPTSMKEGKVLLWIRVTIAKIGLADIYHDIKPEFLQECLNEFCCKFNAAFLERAF